MADDFIVETSIKTAAGPVCKIPEGLYAGKLKELKTKKQDGSRIENKYGPQAILVFDVHKLKEDGTVGERVTFKTDNIVSDAELVQFINIQYKSEETGELSSAFTPKSRATETFKALGWAGPDGKPFNMHDYVGNWARVMVEDYVKTKDDGSKETRSSISKVKPLGTEAVQSDAASEQKASEYMRKVEIASKQLADGDLTQKGYDALIASLKKEYGVE